MPNSIIRNIPNAITCCNLISGCIATGYAFMLDARTALIWIIIGAAFDFFDGMSARLLKVSSPIGKELDSLADDITFGFAPSAIVFSQLSVMDYPAFLEPTRNVLPYIAFIMAAFSALRLAKFNLDERQTTSFIGMPTPANALFWGSLIATQTRWLESSPWMVCILILLVALCCWLLVAELPMFALKFKQWGWKGNEIKYSFIILCAVMILLFGFIGSFSLIIPLYVIISIFIQFKKSGDNDNK